jgi:Domain of unknown function (DUF4177)
MRKYIVDVAESDDASLQKSLDDMAARGWKLVSMVWLPARTSGNGEHLNAQYTTVFEREDGQGDML